MFGYHKAKREKRRAKRQQQALQSEINNLKQRQNADPVQEQKTHQAQINEVAADQRERDLEAQQRGDQRYQDLRSQYSKGLEDKQRRVLQESANSQINRDIQGYEKKLLAQQGRRGVKGGAAFAQQQDLARLGSEAQQQMQRDLSVLDSELAMRQAAAAYNVQQGEIAQEALRNQMAKDTLESYDQRKYQKWLASEANKLFHSI
jgi:hypothetical protein